MFDGLVVEHSPDLTPYLPLSWHSRAFCGLNPKFRSFETQNSIFMEQDVPSGNLLHSYWTWPFMVDVPIDSMVIFPLIAWWFSHWKWWFSIVFHSYGGFSHQKWWFSHQLCKRLPGRVNVKQSALARSCCSHCFVRWRRWHLDKVWEGLMIHSLPILDFPSKYRGFPVKLFP